MEYSKIPNTGKFANAASVIDNNFSKTSIEVEKLKNATTRFKGYFSNEQKLKETHPTPKEGDFSWVGSPFPGTIYDVVDAQWHNTEGIPDTDSVNLNEYYTKEEINSKNQEIQNEINSIKDKQVFMTQAEYDSLEDIDDNKLYFIYE